MGANKHFLLSGNIWEYRTACCAGGCHWDTRLHLLCGRAEVSLGSVSCVRHLTAGVREGFHFLKNWLEHIGTHWNMLAIASRFGTSIPSVGVHDVSQWKKLGMVHWQIGTISFVQLRKAHVDHRDCLLWSEFSRTAFCRGGLINWCVCIAYRGKNLKLKVGSSTATKQKLSWSSSRSSRCFNFVTLI